MENESFTNAERYGITEEEYRRRLAVATKLIRRAAAEDDAFRRRIAASPRLSGFPKKGLDK